MKRSELYALVWAAPVSAVASRLGLSGVGLAKLCGRHDIPIPARGFWARLAAGQAPTRQPLPIQTTDEVIPRFKALDAAGAPLPADALPVEWIIPGVMKRTFPTTRKAPAPAVAAVPRIAPEVEVGASVSELVTSVTSKPQPFPQAPSRPAMAKPAPASLHPPKAPSMNETPEPVRRLGDGIGALEAGAAIDAEVERAIAAALDHERRQAVEAFLSAVAVRATGEGPEASRSILAWVGAVRRRLGQDDPVSRLVEALRSQRAA